MKSSGTSKARPARCRCCNTHWTSSGRRNAGAAASRGGTWARRPIASSAAYAALCTSWERLRKWIEGGKQVIFARNRLADDARRWARRQLEDSLGAEDELLGGTRLAQALEFRVRGDFITITGGLSETEARFLDA